MSSPPNSGDDWCHHPMLYIPTPHPHLVGLPRSLPRMAALKHSLMWSPPPLPKSRVLPTVPGFVSRVPSPHQHPTIPCPGTPVFTEVNSILGHCGGDSPFLCTKPLQQRPTCFPGKESVRSDFRRGKSFHRMPFPAAAPPLPGWSGRCLSALPRPPSLPPSWCVAWHEGV